MGKKSALSTEIVWQILLEYGEKCGKNAPKILLDGEKYGKICGKFDGKYGKFCGKFGGKYGKFCWNMAKNVAKMHRKYY